MREVVLASDTPGGDDNHDPRDVMLEVVTRSRLSLRVLDLGHPLESPQTEVALSLMVGMQSLTMRLHSSFQPVGVLRGALPALTHLAVYCDRDIHSLGSCACFGVLVDLIGGAVASLLRSSVKNFPLPTAAGGRVLAELRRCRKLRDLLRHPRPGRGGQPAVAHQAAAAHGRLLREPPRLGREEGQRVGNSDALRRAQ